MALPTPLSTARGCLAERRGWLLKLTAASGAVGWGEAAPLAVGAAQQAALERMAAAITDLGPAGAPLGREQLEAWIAAPHCPADLAFALGSALAEVDGLVGDGGAAASGSWLAAPEAARLLPAGAAAPGALAAALQHGAAPEGAAQEGAAQEAKSEGQEQSRAQPLSFKWKVAVHADAAERALLEQLLQLLPPAARLRLDANGHWDRPTAWAWADRLAGDPRLQWLEQPLAPGDLQGLEALARRVPVALDESLRDQPQLRHSWPGWQVRRPSQEGDPRPLLAALMAGQPHLVLSTAFETGIARRWLHHLAALQAAGPTPAAPGLALTWQPTGPLLSSNPQQVWEAAA